MLSDNKIISHKTIVPIILKMTTVTIYLTIKLSYKHTYFTIINITERSNLIQLNVK